jgi:L-ascorbate metabolism protein UlaG (beta-lactamase superfamily)
MKLPWRRPDLSPYGRLRQPVVEPDHTGLTVRFLGTSTLVFDDGETTWMTDGFCTRPGKLRLLFGTVAPDESVISETLHRAEIDRLAAVFCVHSHYDHAMDAPLVAARTGADLVGSTSTANVARGLGLPEEQIRVIADGQTVTYGDFEITSLPALHGRNDAMPGIIAAPLVPPQRYTAWKTGSCYTLLVRHRARTIVINASANFLPGALLGQHADVVYLGVTGLSRQSAQFRRDYWRELVATTGARRVIPVHWDDFTTIFDEPLRALPYAMDDFAVTMDFLLDRGWATGVDIVIPPAWQRTDPFRALS